MTLLAGHNVLQESIGKILQMHLKIDNIRVPDEVCIFISKMSISSPDPMFDHLLESWSNIGFYEEITQVVSIEVYFTHLIWSS